MLIYIFNFRHCWTFHNILQFCVQHGCDSLPGQGADRPQVCTFVHQSHTHTQKKILEVLLCFFGKFFAHKLC